MIVLVPAAVVALIAIACFVFGWDRYRHSAANPNPNLQPTTEIFLDPETGQRKRVWYDPSTGKREYRTEP